MRRIPEITLFLNPTANSYRRLGAFEAPAYVSWSRENRSQLIRIPAADGEYARFELRSPDPQCNPYHAFALLMEAGLEGVREGLPLPEPLNLNLYAAPAALLAQCEKLPGDLGEAVEKAASSAFVSRALPQETVEKLVCVRKKEWRDCQAAADRDGFEWRHSFDRL